MCRSPVRLLAHTVAVRLADFMVDGSLTCFRFLHSTCILKLSNCPVKTLVRHVMAELSLSSPFFLLHEKVTGQDTEVLFSRGELFSFRF